MAGINYRFRLTGLALTLNEAFPSLFLPTTRTVGQVMVHQMETKSERLVKNVGKMMIRDMKSATRTWNHKVDFSIKSRISAKSITVSIWTDEPIFNFIEGGTDVRRAIMTRDFMPKTSPGWLGSRKGSGGVSYIGADVAMPGIEARHFYKATAKKHRAYFVSGMREIITEQLRMLGMRK